MKITDVDIDDVTQAELEVKHIAGAVTAEARWCRPLITGDTTEYVYFVFTRRRALLVAWAFILAALTFRRFK
jgi:hypothetical protein